MKLNKNVSYVKYNFVLSIHNIHLYVLYKRHNFSILIFFLNFFNIWFLKRCNFINHVYVCMYVCTYVWRRIARTTVVKPVWASTVLSVALHAERATIPWEKMETNRMRHVNLSCSWRERSHAPPPPTERI